MAAQQLLFGDPTAADRRALTGDTVMLDALGALGADPQVVLSQQERRQLLTQGFLHLGAPLLSPAQCEEAKRRVHAQIAAEEKGEPFSVGSEGESALRLGNLFNKINHDGLFDVAVTHPRLLGAMRLMLGDAFKLSSLNFRGALPGAGHQGFHTDWGENPSALSDPPQFQVCNSIWMLDAFTPDNGATRVLPGSHLTGRTTQVLADAAAPQPGEVLVQGEQGSVCVFSSHLFHGGTLNRSSSPRMAMHGFYTRRCYGQQVDQNQALHPDTWRRLSRTERGRAAIAVLDVLEPAAAAPRL
jgi:hypothetical protein